MVDGVSFSGGQSLARLEGKLAANSGGSGAR
jgi:hypothetical protein